MAIHTSGSITYFLSLPVQHKDYLGAIRHWENLKVAIDEDVIWVKDLTGTQTDSVEVKSMPYKELYYADGPKLFPKGSLLPRRNVPSLLWTPIERGLPVSLPAFNHNYFGITEKASIRLVATDQEAPALALMVTIDALHDYILTAPAIRLQGLQWTLVNSSHALLIGTPLLPLQGEVYWKRGNFLLPAGYDLELYAVSDSVNLLLNPGLDAWILWDKAAHYCTVSKDAFTPLSISSFRLSAERRNV